MPKNTNADLLLLSQRRPDGGFELSAAWIDGGDFAIALDEQHEENGFNATHFADFSVLRLTV